MDSMKVSRGALGGSAHSGHRHRLRSRFQGSSLASLQDYEALEFLLTFALQRIDTKPIAKELLKRFGGLWGVFGKSESELLRVQGVGPRAALLIRLVRELAAACLRDRLRGRSILKAPESVVDYARMALGAKPEEACLLVMLDGRNQVRSHELVGDEAPDHVTVSPRKIVEKALLGKASGFILVHNHPSGRSEPSAEDEQLTRRVKAAAATVDLRFVDHIIVAEDGHFSFRAAGLL
jgi:DNA repair protein RadC